MVKRRHAVYTYVTEFDKAGLSHMSDFCPIFHDATYCRMLYLIQVNSVLKGQVTVDQSQRIGCVRSLVLSNSVTFNIMCYIVESLFDL